MTEEENDSMIMHLAEILNEGKWQLYRLNYKKQAERFLGELGYWGYKIVNKDLKECDCKGECACQSQT